MKVSVCVCVCVCGEEFEEEHLLVGVTLLFDAGAVGVFQVTSLPQRRDIRKPGASVCVCVCVCVYVTHPFLLT